MDDVIADRLREENKRLRALLERVSSEHDLGHAGKEGLSYELVKDIEAELEGKL